MISYFLQAAALGASTQKAPNERKAASVTLRKARHRFLGISWEMWQMMKKNGERFDDTIFFMEMWMMFLFAELFLLMFHGFSQLQASGKVWRDPTLDDWPKEDYRSGFRRIGSVVYQLIGI